MEHSSKEGTSRSCAVQFSLLHGRSGLCSLGAKRPAAKMSWPRTCLAICSDLTLLQSHKDFLPGHCWICRSLILQMFSLRLSPTKCKLNAYLYALPKMFRDIVDIANPSVPLLFTRKMQNRPAWFNELELNWKMLMLINFLARMRLQVWKDFFPYPAL